MFRVARRKLMRIAGPCLLLALSATAGAADPSFDCAKAQAPDEKAICASPELSKLDSLVAAEFATFQATFQPREKVARELLESRQACGDEFACIAAAQLNALDTYGGDADPYTDMLTKLIAKKAEQVGTSEEGFSKSPPQKLAQCEKTRIKELTTRFGRPLADAVPDTGIFIEYDNGGYIYDYDRDSSFDGTAKGQPVVLCLMSIPRDCPTGDDRGRVYYTLDLVTRQSWISGDSEHGCGGA